MDNKKVNREPLSARQLSVAVMVGGLSWVGTQAGRMDWRWALAAFPVGLVLGWLLLRRVDRRPLFCGLGGGALAVLYGVWAVVLMACVLRRAAERIAYTGGNQTQLGWILLLLALPLVWIGWGKAAAFFRLVEVLWLAMAVILAALLILMIPKVHWPYLLSDAGDWKQSFAGMVEVLSVGLFVLPYLYKVEAGEGDRRRGLTWLAVLGITGVVLTGLTVGVLSPALAGELRDPFLTAVGVLGGTARLEGLVSALWLLPDLALAGLLAQSWGCRPRPVIASALAFGVALTGMDRVLSTGVIGGVTSALMIFTLLIPSTGEKIVVPFS